MTVWYAGWMIPPCIPDSHPHRGTNTKCCVDTVISPDDGHVVARKHVEERNKHTKKNCAPSWLYLQDYKTEAMFVGDLMHVSLQCQSKHESLIYRDQQAGICSAGTISPVIPASCKGHSRILWHGDICQLQIINRIV